MAGKPTGPPQDKNPDQRKIITHGVPGTDVLHKKTWLHTYCYGIYKNLEALFYWLQCIVGYANLLAQEQNNKQNRQNTGVFYLLTH